MPHKIEIYIGKKRARALMRWLNHRPFNKEDKDNINKFLTQLRGDVAEITHNETDWLKDQDTRKGIHIAPNTLNK